MTLRTPSPAQRAVEIAGGQSALAKMIGVSPQLVWQWVRGERPVGPKSARAIEAALNRQVTKEELRPDVFGEHTAA